MGNPGKPLKDGKGGDPNLHAAARSGDIRSVESICSSNPLAINSRDKHSRTPLHLAAWSGQTEVVSYLCKHKADVGAAAMDDTAAIHFASQKGHLEVVRLLLSSGASVKATNRKGLTPLHHAAQGSYIELVKFLVKKGANISAKTKGGQTPRHLAENEEVRSYLEECEQLVKKGGQLTSTKKAKEPVNNQSHEEDIAAAADATSVDNNADEGDKDPSAKRKGEDSIEQSLSRPKKAKVSLGHLVAEDDTQDGEEE